MFNINSSLRNLTKNISSGKSSSNLELFLMCLPVLIVIFLFNYLPMAGLILVFKDFRYDLGIWGSKWVGIDNFKFFFKSYDVWNVTKNTIVLNFSIIIVSIIIPCMLALFLYEVRSKRLIKTYQTVLFIPYFFSWVVVGFMAYAFLSESYGVINSMLRSFGLEAVSWYSETKLWPFILVGTSLWKNMGYNTVIYYSALISINSEYFEAAYMDGASKLQVIKNISVPHLIPLATVLFLLGVGRIFYSDFGLFYYLPRNSGVLFPVTDVIDTYIFRSLRYVGDIGMASAVNFYQSVVGCIVILISNFIVRKVDEEYALL